MCSAEAHLRERYYMALHVSASAASTCRSAAAPTTKKSTPPIAIDALVAAQLVPTMEAQTSAGATTRSAFCRFAGCAAGHTRKLREVGTERVPLFAQEREAGGGGFEVPALHDAQTPEQAAVDRPAVTPKVPAGHSLQVNDFSSAA